MAARKLAWGPVLVRLPGTETFLEAGGTGWTRKMEAAESFASPLNAIHTCILCGLGDVELVFCAPDNAGKRSVRLNLA